MSSGGNRVYVGRLNYQTREKDIERFFRGYGHLTEINLKNGFGFVVSGIIRFNAALIHIISKDTPLWLVPLSVCLVTWWWKNIELENAWWSWLCLSWQPVLPGSRI